MIKLGMKVRDRISGLVGIATSRTEFLNGCIQFVVQPKMKKGATEIPSWNIDEKQLEAVDKPVRVKKTRDGGPMRKMPEHKIL